MVRRALGPADRWAKRDWRAGLRAAVRLHRNPGDTKQVFLLIRNLAGRSVERGYYRLLNTPGGGRTAYEHVELLPLFSDPAWLAQFGEGSVGAAYREFVGQGNLSAADLARKSRIGLDRSRNETPHPYAWFGRRVRDVHDIWHVLTEYGADPFGESCLAAFCFAQTGGLGWAGIAGDWAVRRGHTDGRAVRRAIWEAYRRGRRSAWLLGEDYEQLLAEPLAGARSRLGLTSPRRYHAVPADRRGTPVARTRTALNVEPV
jgi:ubiquinone biosynthesis protein COQ4